MVPQPLQGGGLSSPWTFLAYAAARTRRIRLSTAITIVPLEHPIRLAEDVSVVDTLSGHAASAGLLSGAGSVRPRPVSGLVSANSVWPLAMPMASL